MRLVIVESPNKVKKIGGFLGSGYQVAASFGHIRDLPSKGGLGVRFDGGRIEPDYEITKSDQVKRLKAMAKDAEEILIATDPDREGEAIGWHLMEVLGRKKVYRRVTFNAITAEAVRAAVAAPGSLDYHMVDAQQARRVLDRVVGWLVSPTLRLGLGAQAKSAGRVQSVAVRIVAEREAEIAAFRPIDYFDLVAMLDGALPPRFAAKLAIWKGEELKYRLASSSDAQAVANACRPGPWTIAKADTKRQERRPPPPFTTSTAQQAASVKLHLTPERTMSALQGLFEAGLITYHRTDSVATAPEGIAAARAIIVDRFGDTYLPKQPQAHAGKSANAQEAHEAIRPTHPETGPEAADASENGSVYRLVWERFIGSQMANAVDEITRYDIETASDPACRFVARGSVSIFDGWRKAGEDAAEEKKDDEEDDENKALPKLAVGDRLTLAGLDLRQRRTKPPSRFTQASLIKELEKRGVGRPSTFANIIRTIFDRGYVNEEKRKLFATPNGMKVVAWLKEHFAGNFIEIDYTSSIEEVLDAISRGEKRWEDVVTAESFAILRYAQAAGLDHNPLAGDDAGRPQVAAVDGKSCPECQGAMRKIALKSGNGHFFGCLAYPKCKGTSPSDEEVAERAKAPAGPACPKCGKATIRRSGKRGDFFGCSTYPACDGILDAGAPAAGSTKKKTTASAKTPSCPLCKATMRKVPAKKGMYKAFWSCSGYPTCKGTTPI